MMQISILQIFDETYRGCLLNIGIAIDVPAFDNIKYGIKPTGVTRL